VGHRQTRKFSRLYKDWGAVGLAFHCSSKFAFKQKSKKKTQSNAFEPQIRKEKLTVWFCRKKYKQKRTKSLVG
jgi:hypothetical protein